MLQSKFSMRSRGWTGLGLGEHKPRVTARLEHHVTPQAPELWVGAGVGSGAWFTNLLTLRVHNTELGLSLGTVAGLADLAEDEVISTPLPVDVSHIISFLSLELLIKGHRELFFSFHFY